jgi:glutathione peroxidase
MNLVALQKLYDDYSSRGLMIIGFPCSQFMNQEPGTPEQIKGFYKVDCAYCKNSWQLMYPIEAVNGEKTHELFAYCRKNSSLHNEKKQETGVIPWNFSKFLMDRDGKVIKFETTMDDLDG